MAPPSWRTDPSVEQTLAEEPYRFDFFQAVRLLELIHPDRAAVGREGPPTREVARFLAHLSLSFPPSAIARLETHEEANAPAGMVVNFLGLNGPSGVLPLVYTELLIERARQGDHAPAAFLDLLNHRLISLFYRAWEKHHFLPFHRRAGDEPLARYLFHLIGFGTAAMRGRHDFSDRALLPYAGLFGQRHRSAVVLEGLLLSYFGLPVEVCQFAGQWLEIEPDDRSTVGSSGRHNGLGVSFVLGSRIWDEQGKIRLRIGPLDFDEFQTLLPDGPSLRPLAQMTRLYLDGQCGFDVQLVLKAECVPECRLSAEPAGGARLGRHAWLISRKPTRDADDMVFSPG